MHIKTVNIIYCSILGWWLFGFTWIKLELSYGFFGVIWELTFIPSLMAAFVFSLYSIYLQIRGFQNQLAYYFNIILSLIFVIYFGTVVQSIMENIQKI